MTMARFRHDVITELSRQRFLGIVRAGSAGDARQAIANLVAFGTEILEVTLTTPGALALIEDTSRTNPELIIGAGTVLSEGQAAAAATAGARFVVTPNLDEKVVRASHRHGMAVLPGCATATECVNALEAGADAIKLFPASTFGPEYLRALAAPLPHAPFVPTGGVTPEDAGDWIRAGAIAVALGSGLVKGSREDVELRVSQLRALRSDLVYTEKDHSK